MEDQSSFTDIDAKETDGIIITTIQAKANAAINTSEIEKGKYVISPQVYKDVLCLTDTDLHLSKKEKEKKNRH